MIAWKIGVEYRLPDPSGVEITGSDFSRPPKVDVTFDKPVATITDSNPLPTTLVLPTDPGLLPFWAGLTTRAPAGGEKLNIDEGWDANCTVTYPSDAAGTVDPFGNTCT